MNLPNAEQIGFGSYLDNPPEAWIRHDNVFKAIIAPKLFAEAQKTIAERHHRRSDQEMLDLLSALWREKGHLSVNIITSAKNVPPVSNYASRFGSLFNTYERIGYKLDPRYNFTGSIRETRFCIGEAPKSGARARSYCRKRASRMLLCVH
jgi:hypothetical protein